MIRGVGLRGAIAVNVSAMIGAGPLITIPIVVTAMHGSVSVAAWIAGALIALCDGLVFAELAARLPRTGGTYAYLREAYGPSGLGRLMSFLYVWQLCFSTPLLLASGYIGFAQYAGFLVPAIAHDQLIQKFVAAGIGLLTVLALFRPIPNIAKTTTVLAGIAFVTLAVVAFSGLLHPVHSLGPIVAHSFDPVGIGALGAALVIISYDYAGYGDITNLGEEVIAPHRTIPLAVLWSVALVGVSYVLLNFGVFATLTPDAVAHATSVASDVVDRTLGRPVALVLTIGVLITAFASTYSALLGASRAPFAAARDGEFLAAFAILHPTGKYPIVSLAVLGLLALPACFLSLGDVINALTAGMLLVGSLGQIVALALLRGRTPEASFRIPLYPLPPLIAFGSWTYLFIATGTKAMLFGTITLGLGALVFFIRARSQGAWPFVATALCALFAFGTAMPATAAVPTFGHAALVQRDDGPELDVDGKPFFIWGASFFYYRLPADRWAEVLDALKAMHFNTLDLYVPWNWHEIRDGYDDFTGVTDPRRNLKRVLQMARDRGFYFVVRPGPVIRNEWRNGGYPDWLLQRPEYGMPLHDILEGRYPATATLQNANSDDAAAQWMANATHMKYAHEWLTTALREFVPVADRVIAVQLDDDQGAYIDNQTWPAPHLQQYLGWLQATVREVIGPVVPVYINTYEMKVTASSPVWAMGNWYQSDAYSIGEHDRASLEFSTGLLQTQTRGPVAISEFQAGWLAQPEDPQPRPADPTNTTLALHTLLGMGARGVIDFPPIDTFNPAGWEAPFANASYAWDAALGWKDTPEGGLSLITSERYGPTQRFGNIVERYGAELARVHRVADGAIAYLTSAYNPAQLTNADVFTIAARTQAAQHDCRLHHLTCNLVDLAFIDERDLRRYPFLIVPKINIGQAFTQRIDQILVRYRSSGGTVLASAPTIATTAAAGIADATLLASDDGSVFLDVVNYGEVPKTIPATSVNVPGMGTMRVPETIVAGRDAKLVPLDATASFEPIPRPLQHGMVFVDRGFAAIFTPKDPHTHPPQPSTNISTDPFGNRVVTLTNRFITAIVSPNAGGRLISLSTEGAANAVTTVGALRDDATLQPPLSTSDRIGKYTRSFPAGMFNRTYSVITHSDSKGEGGMDLLYDAPDVVPHGAHFHRRLRMKVGEPRLIVDDLTEFPDDAGLQRVVRYDSFDLRDRVPIDDLAHDAFGIYSARAGEVVIVTWRHADVEDAQLIPERTSVVLRLRLARASSEQPRRVVYAIRQAGSLAQAQAALGKERDTAGANNGDGHGEVVKW